MPANPAAASATDKPKATGKKLIIIGVVVVLLLVVVAAGAFMVLQSRRAAADEGDAAPVESQPKVAPTFLPLENMVVNLADPGGDRFAQVGITLELADGKTAEQVKAYLPTIRSGILMLISQRTSQELLSREGKEKLADDVLREVSRPLGYSVASRKEAPPRTEDGADSEDPSPRRAASRNPVQRVLFSSFIVQ